MGMRIYNTPEVQDSHRLLSANRAATSPAVPAVGTPAPAAAEQRTRVHEGGASISDATLNRARLMAQNLQAASVSIRDADAAQAMVASTRQQIVDQAGTAFLVQANIGYEGALKLLQ